jgi:hypothetical protein
LREEFAFVMATCELVGVRDADFDCSEITIVFNMESAQRLGLRIHAQLRVDPPWQELVLPDKRFVLLCTYHSELDSRAPVAAQQMGFAQAHISCPDSFFDQTPLKAVEPSHADSKLAAQITEVTSTCATAPRMTASLISNFGHH